MTTALVVTCVTPTANQQYALQESHSKVALKAPSPRVLCAPCPPLGSLDLLLNRSPSMPIEQALLVLGLSLLISLASEFISWLLVYRTSSYLRIRDELDRNSRRLEQFKQGGNKKDNEKKGKKLEESVKNSARDYQQVKMKANMVTGAVNLLVLNRLLAAFEGTPGGCPLHPTSSTHTHFVCLSVYMCPLGSCHCRG